MNFSQRSLPPTFHPAQRSAVAPFMAMDVSREANILAAKGASPLRLEIGEPGAPPPRLAREAAVQALQGGKIGYTEALGLKNLRQKIAAHYAHDYGLDISPSRIAVTTGSSGAFTLAFLTLFDPGARVGIASPGYPAYRNSLEALGCQCVTLETSERTRHVVTAALIEQAHAEEKLDGVLLMSPANPTGAMMTNEELRNVCSFCEHNDITFISDEIYHGLTYERKAETALKFLDDAIVVNSFSKYYCMTGWRIGWLVLPESLTRPVERLAQSLTISSPYLSQIAALAAFDARDELEAIKAGYARNRALLCDALPNIGLENFVAPDGAFYIYADIARYQLNSFEFCQRMLHEAGVAATPGIDFDRRRGAQTLRLSYAGAHEDILEAVTRIKPWLSHLR